MRCVARPQAGFRGFKHLADAEAFAGVAYVPPTGSASLHSCAVSAAVHEIPERLTLGISLQGVRDFADKGDWDPLCNPPALRGDPKDKAHVGEAASKLWREGTVFFPTADEERRELIAELKEAGHKNTWPGECPVLRVLEAEEDDNGQVAFPPRLPPRACPPGATARLLSASCIPPHVFRLPPSLSAAVQVDGVRRLQHAPAS